MITQKLTEQEERYCFRLIRDGRVYLNGVIMCRYSKEYHRTILESL